MWVTEELTEHINTTSSTYENPHLLDRNSEVSSLHLLDTLQLTGVTLEAGLESKTKVMKLSLVAALAAVAGRCRPCSFERDVDIYSHTSDKELAIKHKEALDLCWDAAKGYKDTSLILVQDYAEIIGRCEKWKKGHEAI